MEEVTSRKERGRAIVPFSPSSKRGEPPKGMKIDADVSAASRIQFVRQGDRGYNL